MSEAFQPGQTVKRVSDGQVGRVVERDGGLAVRLDRGKAEIFEPASPATWKPAPAAAPLSRMAVASIAYAATRQLRQVRGEYGVKEWIQLRDADRIKLAEEPPTDAEQRALWEAVFEALQPKESK